MSDLLSNQSVDDRADQLQKLALKVYRDEIREEQARSLAVQALISAAIPDTTARNYWEDYLQAVKTYEDFRAGLNTPDDIDESIRGSASQSRWDIAEEVAHDIISIRLFALLNPPGTRSCRMCLRRGRDILRPAKIGDLCGMCHDVSWLEGRP